MMGSELVEPADYFIYLGCLKSSGKLVSGEISVWVQKVGWFLPTGVTCGVGEIPVYQPKDELAAQQFDLFYFIDVKHNIKNKGYS